MPQWMLVAGWMSAMSIPTALAQTPPPSYDFDFVTIGDVGNAPYSGKDPFVVLSGRGGVDYPYRIARMEVTTAQWMEFVNTFSMQASPPSFAFGPVFWGAQFDGSYSGPGLKWKLSGLPDAGLLPVGGITWREAAMFTNWLHNAKSADPSAILDGAYDASTFTSNPDGTYNDQLTHHPDAKYWIPTFDEWLKAAHYDPDRHGPGDGGWWNYSHGSEKPPIPGPPGIGQTTAGYSLPFAGEWEIALGAYPGTTSAWGLLDTSGGATEWTEGDLYGERRWRIADGGAAGPWNGPYLDMLVGVAGFGPHSGHSSLGFRIASSIPSPSACAMGVSWVALGRRRRK